MLTPSASAAASPNLSRSWTRKAVFWKQFLKEYFGEKEPSKGINLDEVAAYGAAVQGGILSGEVGTEDVVLVNVFPLTLSI